MNHTSFLNLKCGLCLFEVAFRTSARQVTDPYSFRPIVSHTSHGFTQSMRRRVHPLASRVRVLCLASREKGRWGSRFARIHSSEFSRKDAKIIRYAHFKPQLNSPSQCNRSKRTISRPPNQVKRTNINMPAISSPRSQPITGHRPSTTGHQPPALKCRAQHPDQKRIEASGAPDWFGSF